MTNRRPSRRIGSPNVKPPAAPRIANLKGYFLEDRSDPIPEGIPQMEAAMDRYAASLRKSEPPHVMDFRPPPLSSLVNRPPVFGRQWPPGLFIPETADWKQYWLRPPSAGKNRYSYKFSAGNSSSGNISDPATGELFVHAAARPTDPVLRSEAGIGFIFAPTAKLATYSVEATVAISGQHKYDVDTTADAGGSVREWGGLFVQAWEVSPYDGSLGAVSPDGVSTLFDETDYNLEGGEEPTPTESRNGVVSATIMLEAGRTYLFTVTAVTEIDNAWTMANGAPMQSIPDGNLWKVWTWLGATVTQVEVGAKVVY